MLNYKVKYIWVLFKWVRISKINETYWNKSTIYNKV
jgi:hypothetical protein